MKPLLLSSSDLESGADRSALRLHEGLRSIGVSSRMLVQRKLSSDPDIIGAESTLAKVMALVRPRLDALPLKFYPHRPGTGISPQWLPDSLPRRINALSPDIVNIHMVMMGFMQIETLRKISQPIVWTLHDMWSFTGGCYYAGACERYQHSCGACPQLGSTRDGDLSRWIWQRKMKSWKDVPLTIVCPSRWLAAAAACSSLLRGCRIETIPYGLDTGQFHPIESRSARKSLGLPEDKSIVLFGSINTADPRKGHHYLVSAVQKLAASGQASSLALVSFGASQKSSFEGLGIPVHHLGKLNDAQSLAMAYSAADLFVAPSVQDNLPNTVLEAMACGTPSAAFQIGGMSDMITHEKNGYLAKPFDVDDLAAGVVWILQSPERLRKLKEESRKKAVEEYALAIQAKRYQSLYSELLSRA